MVERRAVAGAELVKEAKVRVRCGLELRASPCVPPPLPPVPTMHSHACAAWPHRCCNLDGKDAVDMENGAILAVHEGDHLNHLVRRSSQLAELLLQLAKKVSPASFSTGLALGCVDSLRPQGTQG